MSDLPPIKLPPISGPSIEECDYVLGVYMRKWGQVEMAVASLIRKLLDTDITTSQIVIRALNNMQAQREMAAELGRHRLKKADQENLERLLEKLKKAATRRNRIIHGTWILQIEMGPKPRPKPLTAKSAKWYRIYHPSQVSEQKALMGGKSEKLKANYTFWPDQIRKDAKDADNLAKKINELAEKVSLQPPSVPQPQEW
ncbi:hypothetical protein M2A_1178 [Tepidicaulis marinus]|uniref:Uncharacterized protein n=1 Tax=Tepidicaulis marinus TaxID=1333998 RepID=A0A081B9G1_9HYPH|nr:hypothetical protein [Tepidicaulis marinus]GAK44679.1 hypothetical protein M2A_1178 [Tepidicaulis marinus]